MISKAAAAEPFQTSPQGLAYLCTTPAAAIAAEQRNRVSFNAAQDMIDSGVCKKVRGTPDGTRFRVVSSRLEDGNPYSQVEPLNEPPPVTPLYIGGFLNAPIDPEEEERQLALEKKRSGCSASAGGEVRQIERGKDGQLFLKRYLIRTECRNGKMVQITTPLD